MAARKALYVPDIQSDMVSPEDIPTVADEAQRRASMPRVSNSQARAMAAEAGVKVDFGDADYTEAAAKIMVQRAVEAKRRGEIIQSSEISAGSQMAIGFAANLFDPVNLIAAFVPIAPAAMVARIEGATTIAGRAFARVSVGAIEGLGGAALVEPLTAFARTQEGADYGTVHFLQNLAFGAGAGAVLRPLAGGIKDVWQSRLNDNPPDTPGDVLSRTYVETHQEMLRQAGRDLVEGNRVSAGQVLDRAASENPKLAERVKISAALRRDGPEIDDTVARQEWWQARLKTASGERRRKGKSDEAAYTERLKSEAGVKPRTKHAIAARMIHDYEKSIIAAERIEADLASERTFLDELTAQGIDESKLSPDERFEIQQDRARINEQLARDTDDIDTLTACILGK